MADNGKEKRMRKAVYRLYFLASSFFPLSNSIKFTNVWFKTFGQNPVKNKNLSIRSSLFFKFSFNFFLKFKIFPIASTKYYLRPRLLDCYSNDRT